MKELEYLKQQLNQLITADQFSIDKQKSWLKVIPPHAGVYLIWFENDMCYVGETGNLKKRMKDLMKTYNHTFRRKLGEKYFSNHPSFYKATSKKKFSDEIESQLNDLMQTKCKISFLATSLGRKELEELVQEKYDKQLLNARGKRK